MKILKKVLKYVFLSVAVILLISFLFLFVNSPGKLDPLTDEQGHEITGSITEKSKIEIGGIEQGFFIRSENPENPVILFLHGGPGSPELSMMIPTEKSERLEKYFTVCWWEQRGSGLSYSNDIDKSTMTDKQMIEDTREITEYLMKRFKKDKIYLIGHSWGTYLGIKTIEKYPHLYSAYIGVGQMTDQNESEKLAYNYMLNHAKAIGDKDAIADLEKYDVNATDFPTFEYMSSARTIYLNKYGIGGTHESKSIMSTVWDFLLFKGYTIPEKIKYIKGAYFSITSVQADYYLDFQTPVEVPVYLLLGKYDYQVSTELAVKYFERLSAPQKDVVIFENSAHSPLFEEPEKFVEAVREVVSQNP